MTRQNEGLLREVIFRLIEPMVGSIAPEHHPNVITCKILAKLNKLGWMSPDECQECQAQTGCKVEELREKLFEIEKKLDDREADLIEAKIQALKEVWEWLEFHRKTGHLNKLVIENLLIPALEKGKLPEI